MMTTIAVVAGLAIGAVVRLRTQRARDLAPAPTSPRRAMRPPAAAMATPRMSRTALLRLRADGGCACSDAQLLSERPLNAAHAPALPLVGCGRVDCSCRYEHVAERRRTERRMATDRRDAIRFEDGRRHRPDRRTPNTVWDQALQT